MSEYDRITRYDDAEDQNPFDLAAWYGDTTHRALRTAAGPEDLTEEIARSTALAAKLYAQRPLLLHRAARAGVDVTELAAAAGISPAQVCAEWRAWADGQRDLCRQSMSAAGGGSTLGLSAVEYAAAENVLGVDGIIREPEFR